MRVAVGGADNNNNDNNNDNDNDNDNKVQGVILWNSWVKDVAYPRTPETYADPRIAAAYCSVCTALMLADTLS